MSNNVKLDILDSEKTFHIIKEIEANPQVTQRYLSKKFSVSLGKVNFLINALIDKGIIKAKNFKNSSNKLAYMYLFTPYGIKTKFELSKKFLEWKTQEYERIKKEIRSYKKDITAYSSKFD